MVEVVRLKFQRNWATPGRFTWKIYREQPCESQLLKVTNTGKTSSNVFISLQLTKNYVEFLPIFRRVSKEVSKNNLHISTIEITSEYVEKTSIFRPSKLHRTEYVETTWIFPPLKLHWKKYVEITWIFRPAKLRRKKYVETTWNFRPSKLHRKSTRKWRGNSSKFCLRRIDVDLTWCARWGPTFWMPPKSFCCN